MIAEIPCPECGKPFEPQSVMFGGRPLFRQRVCFPCGEAVASEREARERENTTAEREKRNAARWEAICPALYRETDITRLPPKTLAKLSAWKYGPKGLLVVGKTGAGKTRCMYQLIRRLFDDGRSIRCYNASEFRRATAAAGMDGSIEQWIERAGTTDAFYFDDLGQMKMTEASEENLLAVIEERTRNLKPIFVSTQYDGDELANQFLRPNRGVAVVRRLREFCEVVVVK